MQMGEVVAEENKLHEQGGFNLDQTLLGPDPEEVAAVIILDDDEADLPIDVPQAASIFPSVLYLPLAHKAIGMNHNNVSRL